MSFAPRTPERLVSRMRFEEVSDLVDMIRAQVSAKQVPQQMQRGISQAVGAAKNGQAVLLGTARPKVLNAGGWEALRRRIPETEMQIDARRDAGIEVILIPLPARLPDHGRNVIGREARGVRDGFITERLDGFTRRPKRLRGRKQIDVVTHAEVGVGYEIHLLRETFDQQMLDTPCVQLFDDFDQRGTQAADALGVVSKIALDAFANPGGQIIAVKCSEDQGQTGAVGE